MPNHKSPRKAATPVHLGPGFIRIIAGQWRGRKLPVQNVAGLRPTTDRIKETVFNWLQADIYGARCLDLFAGSGSLGFEALSRQAAQVTFLEKDAKAHAQLAININALKTQQAALHLTDSLHFLAKKNTTQAPFDLIFIDPPFHLDLIKQVIEKIEENGWLAPDGLIYIESELSLCDLNIPDDWRLLKQKQAGQVLFRLYQKESLA
ncbi:MAG: 16S rRNA (guanine(966)-N(2))-methyltransferase RsmD [Vibrionaceae bacterium]